MTTSNRNQTTISVVAVIVTIVLPIWYGVFWLGGLEQRTQSTLTLLIEEKITIKELKREVSDHKYRIQSLEFKTNNHEFDKRG